MEIILIRHGKPTSADSPALTAVEYTKWIRRYNFSDVASTSRPEHTEVNKKSGYIVSSDLKRAIHFTIIYTGKPPKLISSLYREMEIPRYKLPFTLKAFSWVYLCRVLWMLGCKGPFESYSTAKERSELAADKLIELAKDKGTVVLFGHGYMNLHIRRVLIKRGWLLQTKSNTFWGVTHLQLLT